MRAEISVVIPTLNAEAELPDCLEALFEGLGAGLIRELILSDGGSGDATLAIAEEAGARVIAGVPSRGGQLRRGCAAARGRWLLILHADTRLEPGWTNTVAAHLKTGDGSPACFHLQFRAKGAGAVWVAGWANMRTRLFGLPYGDQGLLVRQDTYETAGGYPDIPLMEDVALVRALPRIRMLPAVARTGAGRYMHAGWLRRGARNLWTLLRYLTGTSPEVLARAYRR